MIAPRSVVEDRGPTLSTIALIDDATSSDVGRVFHQKRTRKENLQLSGGMFANAPDALGPHYNR